MKFEALTKLMSMHTDPARREWPRRIGSWYLTSLIPPIVLLATVLWFVGTRGNPWPLGWVRMDEAAGIAEDFLLAQGADLANYTMIRATDRRGGGEWGTVEGDEWRFAVNPAVGYLVRYFREGQIDGWTVGVSPAGNIYKVDRQILDDEPGARLDQNDALDLALTKLSTELAVPTAGLEIVGDTLVMRPQRTDWAFTFAWPDTFGRGGKLSLILSGDALTGYAVEPDVSSTIPPPARRPSDHRVLGFTLIVLGVFVAVQRHRTKLALSTAAAWGGAVFVLVIAVRALTFPQAMLLMPADSPYAGFVARVALSAIVEALQSAILIGLIVATGEALWRDMLPRVPSLSSVGRGTKTYGLPFSAMVHRAARFALWAAAIVIAVESWMMPHFGALGQMSKLPMVVSGALASPVPSLGLPTLICSDILWDELLYRLWLIPVCMQLVRAPLAIVLSALVAVFFSGYDVAQFTQLAALSYLAWGIVAGVLAVRGGIIAALLFHLFVLGGHSALAMVWTGFAEVIGFTMFGVMGLVIIAILTVPGLGGDDSENVKLET
ncbi:CPBP family intramembrane metalloprotease [candidate division KSB1 bacterium]|nr:CPBP family intramembrane metalloprotease [candidate division KSB1 bacterium]